VRIRQTSRRIRTLDFDIETRLIGFHRAGKFKPAGCEPTSIACSWYGEEKIHVWLQPESTVREMLEGFLPFYNEAEMVTGHYVRKFDLPILNGMLLELGMSALGDKLVHDTKLDLFKLAGIGASQENLSGMYGLPAEKYHMGDYRWRRATRLLPDGIEETRKRVMGDVIQHKLLRAELIAKKALGPPKLWRS
jgi:hypothetical protein